MTKPATVLASIRDHQSRIRHLTEDLVRAGINRESVLDLAREMEIPEDLIREALDGSS